MKVQIANDQLIVTAKRGGAELTSVVARKTGREYLWQADPVFWERHAPVLFPVVGRLRENGFSYNDRRYPMTQHGFARDMDFEVLEKSDDSVSFRLVSSTATRQNYPFDFELVIRYSLSGNILRQMYEVSNTGKNIMYYSIGAHPAFRLPGKFSEYALVFENKEPELKRTLLSDGLLDRQQLFSLEDQRKLPLNYKLFEDDALVFENLRSEKITLLRNDQPVLSMDFKGFPYYGIWTRPGAPFLCLEPWRGIADEKGSNGELENKKGIRPLEKNSREISEFSIRFESQSNSGSP